MIELLMRRRGMGKKSLPYDAKVEYLESTGTQYIDSGLMSNIGSRFEADLQRTGYPSGKTAIWGVGGYSEGALISFRFSNANGIVGYMANKSVSFSQYDSLDRHYYVADIPNLFLSVDNTVASITGASINNKHSAAFWLFRYKYDNGSFGNQYDFIGKCFGAKFYENGTLVRDFIPIRVGQVGYMYDKVSGTLFGNAGTGDFIIGNDV